MPGMMDTILLFGTDQSVEARQSRNNPRIAYDSYRRLIPDVRQRGDEDPRCIRRSVRRQEAEEAETRHGNTRCQGVKEVVEEYKVVKKHTKQDFPQNAHDQLVMARDAVFRSWGNDRAKHYRRINNIDDMLADSEGASYGIRQSWRDQR